MATGSDQPTVAKTCSKQRKFPIGAAAFSDALDGKGADGQARVFTNGADAEFVKGKYADTFKAVVAEASELNLANLGLAAPLAELAPALEMCGPRLRVLDLSGNQGLSGDLEVLSACAKLETLKLNKEHRAGMGHSSREKQIWIKGDLGALKGLTKLKYLDLNHLEGLTGDLGPLKGMSQLTHLNLGGCTRLTGDLGPLQGMSQLTYLYLFDCEGLTGDLAPLEGLTQLTYLTLWDCNRLTGHLGPLKGLTQLTFLQLHGCSGLTGDVAPLTGLTRLTDLDLYGCDGLDLDFTGDKEWLKVPLCEL